MLKLQFSKSDLTVTSSQEEDKGHMRTTKTKPGPSQENITKTSMVTTTPKKMNTNIEEGNNNINCIFGTRDATGID